MPRWVGREAVSMPTSTSSFSCPDHSRWLQGLGHRDQGHEQALPLLGHSFLIEEVGAEADPFSGPESVQSAALAE